MPTRPFERYLNCKVLRFSEVREILQKHGKELATVRVLPMTADRIRLTIQQPSLAKYRVPVFRELSRVPDIDLKLLYGSRPDLPNVEPEGFNAEPVYLWLKRWGNQQFFWHLRSGSQHLAKRPTS